MKPSDHSNQHSAVTPEEPITGYKPSSAVGGEGYSDKQLPCYKGGRKSIKVDNKIAIEFLWLFIAAEYILV